MNSTMKITCLLFITICNTVSSSSICLFSFSTDHDHKVLSKPLRKKTGDAVAYFRHFPNLFLRSYGKADDSLTAQTAFGRLHLWNCKWLNWLRTTISEYACTIMGNIEAPWQYENEVFSPQFVRRSLLTYKPITDSLQRMNNQNETNAEEATRQDVTKVLCFLEGTDETDDLLSHRGSHVSHGDTLSRFWFPSLEPRQIRRQSEGDERQWCFRMRKLPMPYKIT